ncbi:unnamed protein product, partial [Meganyctiphanes norvegica]
MKMDAALAAAAAKYTLRTKSIIKRIESEKKRESNKCKEPKDKQKPPPLSKYRRKTANARERNRMREINEAFEHLQKTIPNLPGTETKELTKITVLRLAVNYIEALANVVDDEANDYTGVEDVRDLWAIENAHMARSEHCVRPSKSASKTSKSKKSQTNKSKSSQKSSSKPEKKPTEGKPKRPSKSKSKAKVCKTASVATSNGAYITMKNMTAHRIQQPGRVVNTEPMMLNMTVKRQRPDSFSNPRQGKIIKLETYSQIDLLSQPLFALTPFANSTSLTEARTEPLPGTTPLTLNQINNSNSNQSIRILSPLIAVSPFNSEIKLEPKVEPKIEFITTTPLSSPIDDLSSSILQELESPVVRNDVPLLEFPFCRNERHRSDSSHDSAFSSEGGSAPSSPFSDTYFSVSHPSLIPLGETSPYSIASSMTSSTSDLASLGSLTSDSDSVFTSPVELGNLLGDEPFEEELDHLTSSFAEGDDTFNYFMGHTTSNFIFND